MQKNQEIKDFEIKILKEKQAEFQELEKLFSGESSLKRFLNLVQHGQDAVWQIDDPLPFLVLNFVQIPWLLLVATIKGTLWSKVNFCLGQVL